MPRNSPYTVLLMVLLAAAAPEAWAQAAEVRCQGPDCAEATRQGGWGLIILGAMFFAIWFMPPRRASEKGVGFMDSLPIMGTLQRRIDKELSGWRRFQWPVIGLSFMALGAAFLFGWI
jgi:hypothetical protein